MKIFNYLLTSIMVGALVCFLLIPGKSSAQTCGGSPACLSTLYNVNYDVYCSGPNMDPFCTGGTQYTCATCNSYIQGNSSYACTVYAGNATCSSCVTNDQLCTAYMAGGGSCPLIVGYAPGSSFQTYAICCSDAAIQDAPVVNPQCTRITGLKPCNSGCVTYCNAGTAPGSCSFCGSGFEPTNTCGTTTGAQTCQHNQCSSGDPNCNSACTPSSYNNSCNYTYNSCSANYTCPGGAGYQQACTTNIFVHVYTDYNHDGIRNGNDAGMAGVTVTDNGGNFPTTNANGDVTFSGKTTGNYTISMTVPAGYQAIGGTSHGVSLTNNSGNQTVNFYLTPLYTVSGSIFLDANHNQKLDNGEGVYTGTTTIHVTGGPTAVSDMTQTSGTYSTPQTLQAGTYTFSITSTLLSGYSYTTPTSWTVTVGNPTGQIACNVRGSPDAVCGNPQNGSISSLNFGVDQPYQISGRVFQDLNKDGRYDGSDTAYTGGSSIRITGPTNITVSSNGSGIYTTGQILLPGTYTVAYNTSSTPLPAGYQFTTANTFSVVVGYSPPCNGGGSPDATCTTPNTSSIANLNFGITNERPHQGSVCLDIRTDNSGGATISDPFPAPGATCGGQNGSQAIINNGTCSTGSGIVYSCTGTFDFGLGSPNPGNYTAGGPGQDTECYSGGGLDVIPTSYNFLMTTATESNITPTNLDNLVNPNPNTSCTTSNCVLPASLPKGIYQVNGNLTLNAASYTFPAPANPNTTSQGYIILVNGDLTIRGNILVPRGSVVVFSVAGDIHIDRAVGNLITDPTNPGVNTPNLEGVYSADRSIIVESYGSGNAVCNLDGTPLDRRLYILGVAITNAAKGGGSFINNRDLCIYDTSCSSVQVGDGTTGGGDGLGGPGEGVIVNYLLNLMADGRFLMNKNFNWQELRP